MRLIRPPLSPSRRPSLLLLQAALLTATLTATLASAGCSMPAFLSQNPQARGIKLDADALKQLVPGTSTRSDVTALIGSPTTKATFDDNQWLYIAEITRPEIGGTQSVLHQTVYVLTFDQAGVLTNVAEKTLADAEPVTVVARTTPSPGSEASFFQQLLGNVGKFSPGSGLGGSTGQQGSSTNPGNF